MNFSVSHAFFCSIIATVWLIYISKDYKLLHFETSTFIFIALNRDHHRNTQQSIQTEVAQMIIQDGILILTNLMVIILKKIIVEMIRRQHYFNSHYNYNRNSNSYQKHNPNHGNNHNNNSYRKHSQNQDHHRKKQNHLRSKLSSHNNSHHNNNSKSHNHRKRTIRHHFTIKTVFHIGNIITVLLSVIHKTETFMVTSTTMIRLKPKIQSPKNVQ